MKNNSSNIANLSNENETSLAHSRCCAQPFLLISFSGGRTSAFMAKYINENPNFNKYRKLFLFANTGKEKEETLIFVNKCDKEFGLNVVWLEAKVDPKKGNGTNYKIVDFETASRNGEPFEAVIKKYGLPSKLYRHCTRELKVVPIHKYARKIFGTFEYLTALGIRADEKHRLKSNPKYIYPLAEINVNEKFIRDWWQRQSFDLGIKDYEGNCDLCFLKSKRKKLTLISENTNIVDWWQKMEENYGSEYQSKFDEIRNLSILDLVQLAQKSFSKAVDKQELRDFNPELDLEYDCFCKAS